MLHDKKWICRYTDREEIDQLSDGMNISPILALVLVKRDIKDVKEVERFLNPTMDHLGDPFLLPDMEVAVERIVKAIEEREKICVYGDYDVDGITSVTLMMKVLKGLGADVCYYIPHRMDEGYGLNKSALEEIYKEGTRLVITVDCGIVSFQEVDYGNSLGMDIIITDHHQCQERVPLALGVINPKREDSNYPFTDLAGVGVAYNLCKALEIHTGQNCKTEEMMDMVAIGTVADMVPLTGDNRILVKKGLEIINNTLNKGLKALIQVSDIKKREINTWHIAFLLAPRINAAGRLSRAEKGVELFLTADDNRALELAQALDAENRERQVIERDILREAVELGEKSEESSILVLSSPNWHSGVVGIVASKVTEKFNKPSIIFCLEEGEARGSARSIPGVDIYHLLSQCKDFYSRFGGHKQAAGLSLEAQRLKEFTREINKIASHYMEKIEKKPVIRVEGDLTGFSIGLEDIEQLKKLEPFGHENPAPLFVKRNVQVVGAWKVGHKRDHLKIVVNSEGRQIEGIFFDWGEQPVPVVGEKVDIAFSPEINEWMDRKTLQLKIKDIKRIEEHPAFLSNIYSALNRIIERENQREETDISLMEGLEINEVDRSKKHLLDVFTRSYGNIVIVNALSGAVELISLLSLYTGTCLCFGRLEGYRQDKNYLLIYPFDFDQIKKSTGELFLYGSNIFPRQLKEMLSLEGIDRLLLLEDDINGVQEEFLSILPERQTFEEVYKYIYKVKKVSFNNCIYSMRRRGYNSLAVIRVIDAFRCSGLIRVQKGCLMLLHSPQQKTDIEKAIPYSAFKEFVWHTEEWLNAVKRYWVDI